MSIGLLKSTSAVGGMTLLSRISGLLRDIAFANLLGDKAAADVFFVAFRIPNFFRRLSAEGAFSAAFVPVFTEFRQHHSRADNQAFLSLMLGRFGLILLVASALGVVLAPLLVSLLAVGFRADPDKYALAVTATRIAFPYLIFISLVAMSAGMLNACGRFAAPAATPILLNICLIGAAVWPSLGSATAAQAQAQAPINLAVGVLVAGALQLAFQLPFLRREKLLVRPTFKNTPQNQVGAAGTKKVLALVLPALFGVSVAQINVLINTLLASLLATGSIAWLYYSDRLMEFPVGVFGIALATVILPHLAQQHSRAAALTDPAADSFADTLDWALRWVVLICVPASVGLIVLAQPLIATIYYHGGFSTHGVAMAAQSLVAFSLGLTPIVVVKVLATAFYARQDTTTPVRIGLVAVLVNILSSLILFRPLQHVGLALSTAIAAWVNAGGLYLALWRRDRFRATSGWPGFALRVLLASLGLTLMLLALRGAATEWLTASVLSRVGRLCGLVLGGGTLYFGCLWLCGMRPKAAKLVRERAR